MAVTDFVKTDLARFSAFAEEFKGESDRGCAVLVLCVLEESLRSLIRRAVADPKSDLRNIAPLGRVKACLDSAVLIGLLSRKEALAFEKPQNIRNEFAHKALERLSFDAPEIALKVRDLPLPIPIAIDFSVLPNRQKFLMHAATIQIVLSVRTDHAKRIPLAEEIN